MSKNKVVQPDFKLAFLLPKYWLVWLMVLIQGTLAWLPYKGQLFLGKLIGFILYKTDSSRKKIAQRNIALCFPHMPEKERDQLLKRNMENTAIGLLEVGMGWWWPNWRVKKHVKVVGVEHLEKAKKEGKGTLLLSMHNLSAEINCRGIGYDHPTVIFYRPYSNPLMEYFQYRGRMHANKYMLGKSDVRGLMKALKDGETCVYLPDQDYGRSRSLFVPFFAVKEVATTTATLIFAKQKNTQTCWAIPTRNPDGSGYTIEITPPLANFPSGDDSADLLRINQELEQAVARFPDQYMWLHRRFKTRPDADAPSLYK